MIGCGGVRIFRLSSGHFSNCQGSDETAQVGAFSIVKRVFFLTKTGGEMGLIPFLQWMS